MKRSPVILAALFLLVFAAGARADGYGIELSQQLFDANGNPLLVANFFPDGALARPSWAVCAPGAAPGPATCTPAGVTNQVFEPGPTAVGTRFFATASYGGGAYGAASDPWLGTVASTTPPTLSGSAKVGARVTPHGGSWTGGWGGEFDVLHVEGCRTRDGRDCTTLAHPWTLHGARVSPAIDPRWSGRYVFAFDQRYARGTAFPAIGYLSPGAIRPTPAGPTVARSAPLGPIAGPGLALRDHPLLQRDSRLLLGRVTCAHRCQVNVNVTTADGDFGAGLQVHGTRRLTVPALDARLDGPLTIRVRIGSTPLVHVLLPAHSAVAARARPSR